MSLERALGIDRDFALARETLAERRLTAVGPAPVLLLVTPDGRVLRKLGGSADVRSQDFTTALATPNGPGESASGTRYPEGRSAFYIPTRIYDADKRWVASLIAVVDRAGNRSLLQVPFRMAGRNAALVLGTALALYALYALCPWTVLAAADEICRDVETPN